MAFLRRFTEKIQSVGLYLSKPHVLFYALPWLMILLILGTVSQKELGLFRAVEIYFNSWILWLGPIPTPGGLATLGIIFLALAIKFIFYSPWAWKKAGTILTHLGVLLLLIGGIVTTITNQEGFMIIPEGETVEQISDYQKRVLTFKHNDEIVHEIDFQNLKSGTVFNYKNYEFKVSLRCNNCGARAPSGEYENLAGLAENMELYAIPDEKNIEANFSGLVFQAKKTNETDTDSEFQTYIIMEDVKKSPEFKTDEGIVTLFIEREKTRLPFAVQLKDFRKIDYAGTNKAQGYESDLMILDEEMSWPVTIRMNKPLRYKGYSFYQSSFDQVDGQEVSVLNVVKNDGQIFPYISTLIIFTGLLLHLLIRLIGRPTRGQKA